MKAIIATPEGARLAEVPKPVPGPNEILVRVHAVGLNRIDLVAFANPANQVPGMEWAGEVVEMGADARGFRIGDKVMGTGPAAYAEYAVTDWGRACPVPDTGLGWAQAASLPLALQTMHDALVTRGRLKPGDAVLIHGASSGMGLVGLQIAKALGAGVVLGTSGNAGRRAQLGGYGCDVAVDSSAADWPARVLEATGGRGADIVVDQVSGAGFNQCMAAAALCARLVNVGRLGGAQAAFDFNLHALRRLEYIGVTFRTRSVDEIRTLNAAMRTDLEPLLAAGRVAMPVAGSFAFADAAAGLAALQANQHLGKLVLQL
ncbi:quinone oxidoreductase family protein [Pseudorhodoferax sp.]|uniref:quinone oxidoreductase family protein n=1 Tax=Pseudorhodoferax sp. TaxID=1993553 RepID=UPI002DD625CD|nr:zinc-binding dehydrogenase [Pseudorhodoferax sp.]